MVKKPSEIIQSAFNYGILMHNLRWHLDNNFGNHQLKKLDEDQKWTKLKGKEDQ